MSPRSSAIQFEKLQKEKEENELRVRLNSMISNKKVGAIINDPDLMSEPASDLLSMFKRKLSRQITKEYPNINKEIGPGEYPKLIKHI